MRSSSFLKYIYPELLVLIVMSQPALGLNCQLAFNLMQHFKKSWYLIILFWSPFTGMSGLLRYNKFILFYKEYMVWKHKSKGIFRYQMSFHYMFCWKGYHPFSTLKQNVWNGLDQCCFNLCIAAPVEVEDHLIRGHLRPLENRYLHFDSQWEQHYSN